MAGTLQATPWGIVPYVTPGSFPYVTQGSFASAPVANLLQQLQIVPQQLQQVQQVQQQLVQFIQFLPQQVAQLVQQVMTSSPIGIPTGVGIGAGSHFSGLSTATPLQSPIFGNPFQSLQAQFPIGQPGYVM